MATFDLLAGDRPPRRARRPPPAGRFRARDGLLGRPARGRTSGSSTGERGGSMSSTSTGPATEPAGPRRGHRRDRRRGRGSGLGGGRRRAPHRGGQSRRSSARVRRGPSSGRPRSRIPAFAAALVAAHGPEPDRGRLDVRDGLAVGRGWVPGHAGVPLAQAIDRPREAGVRWFEVTAIDRDGTLEGPDLALLAHRDSGSARCGSSPRAGSHRSTICAPCARSAAPARSSAGPSTKAPSISPRRSRPRAHPEAVDVRPRGLRHLDVTDVSRVPKQRFRERSR